MGETPMEYPEIADIYAAVSREIMDQRVIWKVR